MVIRYCLYINEIGNNKFILAVGVADIFVCDNTKLKRKTVMTVKNSKTTATSQRSLKIDQNVWKRL